MSERSSRVSIVSTRHWLTVLKIVGGAVVVFGLILRFVQIGEEIGSLKTTVRVQTKTLTKIDVELGEQSRMIKAELQRHADQQSRVVDLVQQRLELVDSNLNTVRGSIIALQTEVRIRHPDSKTAPEEQEEAAEWQQYADFRINTLL